jgi:hypothetical protein
VTGGAGRPRGWVRRYASGPGGTLATSPPPTRSLLAQDDKISAITRFTDSRVFLLLGPPTLRGGRAD